MANGSTAKAPTTNSGEGLFTRMRRGIRGGKVARFLIECKIETMDKASWPTRQELWTFTLVVLFALIVVAVWIGLLDTVLQKVTELISK